METHTPAASSSFFLISENLCPCDHLALLLSSHLAGIRNHSLLAVDFNVSLLMTLVSSKILRYHARANCSYQWATIPDVNMHYFLHFSCFIEVFFFFPQAFIHYSHFFPTAMSADDILKSITLRSGALLGKETMTVIHLSFILRKKYSKLSPVLHNFHGADTLYTVSSDDYLATCTTEL